ncbi:acylphosphatase [Virgibacillus kimchii]
MNEEYPYWLSKQMLKGVRSFNIDAFLVALEGWRRGLSLKFYSNSPTVTDLKLIGFNTTGKTFSLSSNDKKHFFYRSRGDKVNNEAVEIGGDKGETKRYLSKKNIAHPVGMKFDSEVLDEEIIERCKELGFPLVIKPTFGSLGKGVTTNIRSEEEIKRALLYARSELGYTEVIAERYVEGFDVRVYVMGDKVLAALKRIPANITGDGAQTVEELINLKNEARKANPSLSSKLIKINEETLNYLNKTNYSLETVPEKDETVYLIGTSNISSGGDSIDFTEELPDFAKNVAINAVKSVPGLLHAGVDILINKDHATVIEINPTADIAMHAFPMYGEPRNIAEGIIDYYFPETKGKAENSTQIYFDYKNILELFRSNSVKQLEVADAPVGELYAKRYVVSGIVQGVGYRKWIRKQALQLGLNGYTRNLANGNVVVVVGGIDKHVVDNFIELCEQGTSRTEVSKIKEFQWETQIKIGFEIRKSN